MSARMHSRSYLYAYKTQMVEFTYGKVNEENRSRQMSSTRGYRYRMTV